MGGAKDTPKTEAPSNYKTCPPAKHIRGKHPRKNPRVGKRTTKLQDLPKRTLKLQECVV